MNRSDCSLSVNFGLGLGFAFFGAPAFAIWWPIHLFPDLHKNGSGPNGAKRTLKAIDLVECSIVTFPADKFARVSGVKYWLDTEPVDEAALAKAWAMADFEALRRITNSVPR
jgi:hypothetical protein